MKQSTASQSPKTIDEVCGCGKGTFDKFLKQKSRHLAEMDQEVDRRIRQSRVDELA